MNRPGKPGRTPRGESVRQETRMNVNPRITAALEPSLGDGTSNRRNTTCSRRDSNPRLGVEWTIYIPPVHPRREKVKYRMPLCLLDTWVHRYFCTALVCQSVPRRGGCIPPGRDPDRLQRAFIPGGYYIIYYPESAMPDISILRDSVLLPIRGLNPVTAVANPPIEPVCDSKPLNR